MKRKFAVLAVLGALVALAIPASSPAAMYPAGAKFEIVSGAQAPFSGSYPSEIVTSLGSCEVPKITGTVPSTGNEGVYTSLYMTPTVGTCTAGTSITLGTPWNTTVQRMTMISSGQITMRFSSLPGCKLSGNFSFGASWGSSLNSTPSGYHADSAGPLTWSLDTEGSCALAGKQETVLWQNLSRATTRVPISNVVNDLTSPLTPITVK